MICHKHRRQSRGGSQVRSDPVPNLRSGRRGCGPSNRRSCIVRQRLDVIYEPRERLGEQPEMTTDSALNVIGSGGTVVVQLDGTSRGILSNHASGTSAIHISTIPGSDYFQPFGRFPIISTVTVARLTAINSQ